MVELASEEFCVCITNRKEGQDKNTPDSNRSSRNTANPNQESEVIHNPDVLNTRPV